MQGTEHEDMHSLLPLAWYPGDTTAAGLITLLGVLIPLCIRLENSGENTPTGTNLLDAGSTCIILMSTPG